MPKVFAIVPAAGQGTRIGDAVPKQYLPIAGKPMMFHAIEVLAAVPRIACVCVVLSPLDRHWGEHDWSAFPDKIEPLFAGGSHRADTVRNALDHLGPRLQRSREPGRQVLARLDVEHGQHLGRGVARGCQVRARGATPAGTPPVRRCPRHGR